MLAELKCYGTSPKATNIHEWSSWKLKLKEKNKLFTAFLPI